MQERETPKWKTDENGAKCFQSFEQLRDINKPPKNIVICVEGNIGSGKTELLRYFERFEDVEVFTEPIDRWRDINGGNGLAHLYEDPTRWAHTFQTYVQLTMLQRHLQPQLKPYRLCERSFLSGQTIFTEGAYRSDTMNKLEFDILTEWYNYLHKTNNLHVDLFVYLRTKPETVYERIKSRCRKEEGTISLSYLENIHNLHEEWFMQGKSFPRPENVLVLDGDKPLKEMKKEYLDRKNEILKIPVV